MPLGRNISPGFYVDLIAKESEGRAQGLAKLFLQAFDLVNSSTTEFRGYSSQTIVVIVASERDRNDRRAYHLRILSCEIAQCFFQNRAIVDLRTKNYLRMDLDVVVQQAPKLS